VRGDVEKGKAQEGADVFDFATQRTNNPGDGAPLGSELALGCG
jgi:hypothetical protein